MGKSDLEKLKIGDKSTDLKIEIVDEDRLCYLVKSESRGSFGIRTISKKLLEEFVDFFESHPNESANDAREVLTGKSELDKFEYGYAATLAKMAKMIINPETECISVKHSVDLITDSDYAKFKHLLEYFCAHLQYIVSEDEAVKGYDEYIKPFVDKGTFKKAGQGYNGGKIQLQIQQWEQYSQGKVCIAVHGQSFQGKATYLHWNHTPHDILANWKDNKIKSLLLVELDENTGERKVLDPCYTLDELGLYDGKEPNENLKKFYDAFVDMLKNEPEQEETSSDEPVEPLTFGKISPRQIIYYGAPGTGKSHTIKKEEDEGLACIRTTFHPDSDYSTFVGCYKPHKCKESGELTYEFVEQAFLEAYKQAWLNPEKEIALVIEEINRGNCAQVFGDIFQLLDRDKDGWSTYPIKADTDICDYLKALAIPGYQETLRERYGKDKEDKYKDEARDWYGYMALPPNMSILATMNTSDQSLFPIDSAFKRRWDWQYVPICDAGKAWTIEVGGNKYDWWLFLSKINTYIYDATFSEDKKLGYFFCKAENRVISAEKFVGKVIFYLWNDVFKDTEFDGDAFRDEDGSKLSFDKFYLDMNGVTKVNEDKVEQFLRNLDITPIEIDTVTE